MNEIESVLNFEVFVEVALQLSLWHLLALVQVFQFFGALYHVLSSKTLIKFFLNNTLNSSLCRFIYFLLVSRQSQSCALIDRLMQVPNGFAN